MKRDMDLIRELLLEIEKWPAGSGNKQFAEVDGFDKATVDEHLALMNEGGLISANVLTAGGKIVATNVKGMTWKGHDFIDTLRSDTVWAKVKEKGLKTAGSLTMEAMLALGKMEVHRLVGLIP